jgi:hypothetical protein
MIPPSGCNPAGFSARENKSTISVDKLDDMFRASGIFPCFTVTLADLLKN